LRARAKKFQLGSKAPHWLSDRMTGAFLNACGILIGALLGLAQRAPLSASTQHFFRRALGAAAAFLGLRLVWLHVNGTFWPCTKQLLIALLALTLGNWTGRLLRLQKNSNRLGRFASRAIASAQTGAAPHSAGQSFIACTILFCAAPLGLLGAVTEGVSGDYYLFAAKAVMDGLAMTGFVKMVGWPTALAAFPVYALLGGLTLACHAYGKPLLEAPGLMDSVNTVAGLIACTIALVILEARKVELTNYLPALAIAPLLTWLMR